jgi:sigma-54-specific transcriptional regulator
VTSKSGWFESAEGGTLFLDEIGDLSFKLQVKLLRVLQEREVVRVGSRKVTPIDVRLIAATNVNLDEAVAKGTFREDLLFRLKVVTLRIPALRERPGDILPLAERFLRIYAERAHLDEVSVSPEVIQRLLDHSWPGNVRELENVIYRAVLTCHNGRIELDDVPIDSAKDATATVPTLPTVEEQANTAALKRALNDLYEAGAPNLFDCIDSTVINTAFEFCHRNQSETARMLGISRNILRARLQQIGILPERRSVSPGGS